MPIRKIPSANAILWLSGLGISARALMLFDYDLALPERDWFYGEFAKALTSFRNSFLRQYHLEWADCDNFSSMGFFLAQALNAKTPGVDAELAVGEFAYQKDDGTGHAILVAIVSEGGPHRLIFMEPQTSQPLHLTQTEIESCIFCRF